MIGPLDVIIVGGGIGGLFTANALIARETSAMVYEQAPALREIGAGVFCAAKQRAPAVWAY